jgi:capsular polysaccharide biosynthesis protein
VIAHGIPAFTRDALERSGVAAKLLEPARYSHFQCEQLIVPSLIGQPGYPIPAVSRRLQEFTAGMAEGSSGFGERLYLSREKSRRRRLTNEAELWAALSTRGFTKVHVEALSWPQQIAAFRDAKVVVAPHGAALANCVFCRPGAQVVEIFNRSYVNGCYWRLASVQGLDYRAVVANGSQPLEHRLEGNALDMSIDMNSLVKAISA